MLSLKNSFVVLVLFFATYISAQSSGNLYKEKYRPQYHFTPAVNWTNDPNGLVYFQGEYHLFYQYNPFGNRWGHMSWGHAVSTDLIHWQHLPLAIPEKDSIMIFSGSAVVDENNTANFATKKGQVPLVAIYTAHVIADKTKPDDYRQEQHIAYSLDKGRTWTKYSGNPVLDIHKKDFRDPKVFWYAPEKKWVMALVLPHEHIVQLYTSQNLKDWTHLSDFGPEGDTKEIWECPDLLQVPVAGLPGKYKWVMFNSQQTTVQYFVGEFDGKTFRNENGAGNIFRQDYGPDYYAVVTYNGLPATHKPVSIGWANNWTYANEIPTLPWKSAMSLPRELSVKKIKGDWILIQQSVSSVKSLRTLLFSWKGVVNGSKELWVKGQVLEASLTFTLPENGIGGINLAVGKNRKFVINYNAKQQKLSIDRSQASDTTFNKSFDQLSKYEVRLAPDNGVIKLQIFMDKSIIEVYANDGKAVLTAQVFTSEENNGINLFSTGSNMNVKDLKIWKLKPAMGTVRTAK